MYYPRSRRIGMFKQTFYKNKSLCFERKNNCFEIFATLIQRCFDGNDKGVDSGCEV